MLENPGQSSVDCWQDSLLQDALLVVAPPTLHAGRDHQVHPFLGVGFLLVQGASKELLVQTQRMSTGLKPCYI